MQGGQPAPGQGRRRRRRRRRGRGAQVLFTPEGQAYRMAPGPDGQQAQVFLTPQELQQHQARLAQLQQQQGQGGGGGQQRAQGGGQQGAQSQPQLQPVEGVLDTDVK